MRTQALAQLALSWHPLYLMFACSGYERKTKRRSRKVSSVKEVQLQEFGSLPSMPRFQEDELAEVDLPDPRLQEQAKAAASVWTHGSCLLESCAARRSKSCGRP